MSKSIDQQVRNLKQNGVYGTCASCPQSSRTSLNRNPHLCKFFKRYDHQHKLNTIHAEHIYNELSLGLYVDEKTKGMVWEYINRLGLIDKPGFTASIPASDSLSDFEKDCINQYQRNGVWGVCEECPRAMGIPLPEDCVNFKKPSHQKEENIRFLLMQSKHLRLKAKECQMEAFDLDGKNTDLECRVIELEKILKEIIGSSQGECDCASAVAKKAFPNTTNRCTHFKDRPIPEIPVAATEKHWMAAAIRQVEGFEGAVQTTKISTYSLLHKIHKLGVEFDRVVLCAGLEIATYLKNPPIRIETDALGGYGVSYQNRHTFEPPSDIEAKIISIVGNTA